MALFAIGDIQGCHKSLKKLLKHIGFQESKDTLLLVGDLVNRGPDSLSVVRTIMEMGDSAISVLGNHDLHFLAVASGAETYKSKDTFRDVLDSPQLDEIVAWYRQLPLLHVQNGFALTHAGIWPGWTTKKALRRAREVEEVLKGKKYAEFLRTMYGNKPDRWSGKLQGWERIRFITNSFTRMRYVDNKLRLNLSIKGRADNNSELLPWFKAPSKPRKERIIFGHWSALGLYNDLSVIALDTGCIWGESLTAVRLDISPVRFYSVDCRRRR
ncbi:MAG: diadenosine tetraphosphatase [Gammaproteobacteria bacterium]|nr:MAG: diadenosine tetraphosphatase [Gammaproteobacteria bacterium]